MTKDEALKLALEALETNNKAWKHLADSGDAGFWEAEEQPFYEISVKAITAIKEALAQPAVTESHKQKPVGWYDSISGQMDFTFYKPHRKPSSPSAEWIPVYSRPSPPQRKPLTDEEIAELWLEILGSTPESGVHEDGLQPWRFAVAIETKLKEKNGL